MSDGTIPQAPAAAPSAPAPVAAPAAPAPQQAEAAPAAHQPASEKQGRQRDEHGRFARREPGPTRRALMREAFTELNEPTLDREAPKVPDDEPAKVAAEKPAEQEKPAAEQKQPEVSDDPKTWPEPARVAHEQLAAQVAEHKQTLDRWQDAGRKAVEQNRRLAEEVKLLRGVVQQAGLQIDPRDIELIRYRVGEQTQRETVEQQQAREAAQQEQARQQAQMQAKNEAAALVQKIGAAAKAAGVPARDVGLLVHAQIGIDGKADIEAAIRDVKDRLTLRQQQVNAQAPSIAHQPSIPTSNTRPHDRSRAGKESRLRQWGVDF